MLKIIPRHQLDVTAWDACVAESSQRVVYGYSWYLDTVLPAPIWKWVGIVLTDETGQYQAVMPVPLRKKPVAGLFYAWVVHQPFFCQFLAVFSRSTPLDPAQFFRLMSQQFRYGSTLSLREQVVDLPGSSLRFQTTHSIDLSAGYETIYQGYTRDRKLNLSRARLANWVITDATDPEPLLTLFRENHASGISNGVADWAYDILRNLFRELHQRNLIVLRYASQQGRIEAGVLFVQEGGRIIYLFNAASALGRKDNARTLLIDQLIQERAGCIDQSHPVLIDFESPEKRSIRAFYQSFGAVHQSFWIVRWSRLTWPERVVQSLLRSL